MFFLFQTEVLLSLVNKSAPDEFLPNKTILSSSSSSLLSNQTEPIMINSSFQTKSNIDLTRRQTDLNIRLRNGYERSKSKLKTRHSFLVNKTSNDSIYSRLSYNFSSLDKEAIENEGIRVRHVVLTNDDLNKEMDSIFDQTVSNDSGKFDMGNDDNDELFGLASVMQTTQSFVHQSRSKSNDTFSSPILSKKSSTSINPFCRSVSLIPMVVGPRFGNIKWTQSKLDEFIQLFNTNEFGLFMRPKKVVSFNFLYLVFLFGYECFETSKSLSKF